MLFRNYYCYSCILEEAKWLLLFKIMVIGSSSGTTKIDVVVFMQWVFYISFTGLALVDINKAFFPRTGKNHLPSDIKNDDVTAFCTRFGWIICLDHFLNNKTLNNKPRDEYGKHYWNSFNNMWL